MSSSEPMGRTHLVIPDAHSKPDIDNRRFDWLGQIIVDLKPDVIVCLGDFADMESLSSYDKGTRGYEGKRYKKDIEAAREAMDRTLAPLRKLNSGREKNKAKKYRPEMHFTFGNHEHRIERATNYDPMLDGTIGLEDFGFEHDGWKTYPFLCECEVDGVTYSHYAVSGVMARPIAGEHPATMLLNKQHKSFTVGHSHLADFSQRRVAGGRHIMGCVAGCYFEHHEEYVPPSVNHMWWRGVVIKRNVVNGCYDPHFYSMNTIKKEYMK